MKWEGGFQWKEQLTVQQRGESWTTSLPSSSLNANCIKMKCIEMEQFSFLLSLVSDPRFGEFCSCCCLPCLPQLAWEILETWGPLFSPFLYWFYRAKKRLLGDISILLMLIFSASLPLTNCYLSKIYSGPCIAPLSSYVLQNLPPVSLSLGEIPRCREVKNSEPLLHIPFERASVWQSEVSTTSKSAGRGTASHISQALRPSPLPDLATW